MTKIKRMDIAEFRELGYLQEVNRLFFHPLGLALEVVMDTNTGEQSLGGVWDYRHDPEGMVFGTAPEKYKADYVYEEKEKRAAARRRRWGWVTQPAGKAAK